MSELGQKIIAAVRKHAAQKPDFIYQPIRVDGFTRSCLYVHEGKPSCIVGQALWDCGLIDATLEFSFNRNSCGISSSSLVRDLDPLERAWLAHLQSLQDSGEPWCDAVASADRVMPVGAP